eukprot:gene9351-1684_t
MTVVSCIWALEAGLPSQSMLLRRAARLPTLVALGPRRQFCKGNWFEEKATETAEKLAQAMPNPQGHYNKGAKKDDPLFNNNKTPRGMKPVTDRFPDIIEKWSPGAWLIASISATAGLAIWNTPHVWLFGSPLVAYLWYAGLQDIRQPNPPCPSPTPPVLAQHSPSQEHQTLRKNFPFLARMRAPSLLAIPMCYGSPRYLLESIRPEIRQYFIEDDHDDNPFSRERRNLVYRRAKGASDTLPFGTHREIYKPGFEWINHSMYPTHMAPEDCRVTIGEGDITYSAALLNISAMSYGALSPNAQLALNMGAKMGALLPCPAVSAALLLRKQVECPLPGRGQGCPPVAWPALPNSLLLPGGFYHNTGEGGIADQHLEHGGDLLGTGYFGCRTLDGKFCEDLFKQNAAHNAVKMIEIKISQGAKPGHGGILPAAKITAEIARIRNVPMDGTDINSPGAHSAFSNPTELVHFIKKLRDISGKPVGFKLCVGNPVEFLALCKAMLDEGICPDFITIDGAEGGTGAAPQEFINSMGTPLMDGLAFANRALIATGLRNRIKLIASGKVANGFQIVRMLAIGADLCNSARGMMFALGCIQALKCNTNHCPTGVATTNQRLWKGLDPDSKSLRVASFQHKTVEAAAEMMGAAGIKASSDVRPWHLYRRISPTE